MSKLTRNGIAYDFEVSPYRLIVDYSDEELEFVFSSQTYKEKFYNKFLDNRIKINESLSKRFGLEIENNKLADLKLYSTIEKRGFLIVGKEKFNCLNTIKLDGVNLMSRN